MTMESLDKDVSAIDRLRLNVMSLNTAINELQTDVRKHHKLLIEGNGELPLVEQMRNVNKYISDVKFWFRTIAVSLVLQLVTFTIAGVIGYIKLLPLLTQIANK